MVLQYPQMPKKKQPCVTRIKIPIEAAYLQLEKVPTTIQLHITIVQSAPNLEVGCSQFSHTQPTPHSSLREVYLPHHVLEQYSPNILCLEISRMQLMGCFLSTVRPSSNLIILWNKSHGKIIRVCMGIFTTVRFTTYIRKAHRQLKLQL